jgi:hypothetical protein
MEVKIMKQKIGLAVTATMRELLLQHGLCDFATAEAISQVFDEFLVDADWLETLNGTTFDKTFVPQEDK